MNTSPGGPSALSDECPVDLHYADPRPSIVDLDAIVRDGRRIRRRRKTTVSLGSAAALAVVVGLSVTVPHTFGHAGTVKPAGFYGSSVLTSFPPVDAIAILGTYKDTLPTHRSAIAWITQNGELCFGTANMSAHSGDGAPTFGCTAAPDELTTPGPTTLVPGWPVFQASVTKTHDFLAIGVLRGSAATVEVTANGQTAEAPVYSLATTTGQAAGAYAVWLRAEPDGSIHSADITRIRALDGSGQVIAHIP